MNPHWAQNIYRTLKQFQRQCPHCGKTALYPQKRPGQLHLCQHCQHQFKEKGQDNRGRQAI
jgi:ribosomal protein L37AE/L43A